jgi:hypothetical protein
MSFSQRQQSGVDEDEQPHYWGSADKKEALEDYVVCAFMPPWWMCMKRPEELAMILLDAEAICCKEGVCFVPTNSARNQYGAAQIVTRTGVEAFDECFQNPTTYHSSDSEIFVPLSVPLHDFRVIVFCDEEARTHWTPLIDEAYNQAPEPRPQLPAQKVSTTIKGTGTFYFPGTWKPTVRIR